MRKVNDVRIMCGVQDGILGSKVGLRPNTSWPRLSARSSRMTDPSGVAEGFSMGILCTSVALVCAHGRPCYMQCCSYPVHASFSHFIRYTLEAGGVTNPLNCFY